MAWVWSNLEQIWGLVLSHIALSVPPIIVGFVLSIPLGYWASRSRLARSVLLSIGGVLYTIPSLALLVVVPVILGTAILAPSNVVFALSIYAVAIMVRSSADAFSSVSDDVRESATAVGYSTWQRFFAVEFPLAGPVLLAGIRVVSVSTVSLVTVGSVIGISSLGNLFTDGINRNIPAEIIVGIVCVLLIAAIFDLILAGVGRLLLPWNRSAASLTRAAERASTLVTQ
ncbi:MAG: proW [Microbacteriaceae bacterium]|nr:proW [Microbacteriaceae bacterium]